MADTLYFLYTLIEELKTNEDISVEYINNLSSTLEQIKKQLNY